MKKRSLIPWILLAILIFSGVAYGMYLILELNNLLSTILYSALLLAIFFGAFSNTIFGKQRLFKIKLLEENFAMPTFFKNVSKTARKSRSTIYRSGCFFTTQATKSSGQTMRRKTTFRTCSLIETSRWSMKISPF
ncbi:MAG: hypothetical protein MZU97_23175 [Bacillus subtilis]|nr:hypothetical protein [Bacillus subtilis]